MERALVTGKEGLYPAELLLAKNYEVREVVCPASTRARSGHAAVGGVG